MRSSTGVPSNIDEIRDQFLLVKPLIERWLGTETQDHLGRTEKHKGIVESYIKRCEAVIPTYDTCIANMAHNGWNDDTIIAKLNEKTKGRFSENPDAQYAEEFDHILHTVLRKALSHRQKSGSEATSTSLDIKRFLIDCAETTKEAYDVRMKDIEYPNPSPEESLKFARRILAECCVPKGATRH